MKTFNYIFLILILISFHLREIYAQDTSDHVQCDLRIFGNQVPCSFFGLVNGCPFAEFEESNHRLTFGIHEGEKKTGIIKLKKMLVDPGGPYENDFKIFLFLDDKREENLKVDKKIDVLSFELETKIKFDARREYLGTFIDFEFMNTKKRAFEIYLPGESDVERFLSIDDIGIKLSCRSITKAINQDTFKDKKIEFNEKKKNSNSAIAQ